MGAGLTGLTIGYELSKRGYSVDIYEAASELGGLAGSFTVGNVQLDKFYHHWFNTDVDALSLVHTLNLDHLLAVKSTATSMYYANNFYKLSTPLDLLRFSALSWPARLRLGIMTVLVRYLTNFSKLEELTAQEWLTSVFGEEVFNVVWRPLLYGKFGKNADDVSAVWIWNKLKLRGGSRNKKGNEQLIYLRGGFSQLADELSNQIKLSSNNVFLNSKVASICRTANKWTLQTERSEAIYDQIICTTSPDILKRMIDNWAPPRYLQQLSRIKYLGNVCLVLELNKSLSDSYWINVNDPEFPFVGVIEHTNFENADIYSGSHIVYLSKYLEVSNELFDFTAEEFLFYSLPYLKRMFPSFSENNIIKFHLWSEAYSQPIVEKNYSKIIAGIKSPFEGLRICCMAQIYPEDRGTNYAIKYARNFVLSNFD